MGVPLPFLVTGRGYAKMAAAGLAPGEIPSRALLVRPDVDSVALHTEPTLRAWGIPFQTAGEAADAAVVRATIEQARREERPVALVLTRPLS
jgi:hypothetical protein